MSSTRYIANYVDSCMFEKAHLLLFVFISVCSRAEILVICRCLICWKLFSKRAVEKFSPSH